MVELAAALAPPPPVIVTLGAVVYQDPGVISPIATTLPDCIVAAAVAVTPLERLGAPIVTLGMEV